MCQFLLNQQRLQLSPVYLLIAGAANSRLPLSVCLQNCNSLNLTGTTGNFDAKLTAIIQAKTDIILLSDTRVVSVQGVSSTHRISNTLRDNSIKKYTALFNSSSNSRGTAILISMDVDYVLTRNTRIQLKTII
jgi:hypothetical protein